MYIHSTTVQRYCVIPQYQNEVKHKKANFDSTQHKGNHSENVRVIFQCPMKHSLLPPQAHCSDFLN